MVTTVLLALLLVALQAYALSYLAYLWAPALAALWSAARKRRFPADPPPTGAPRERAFAILISAHDEEAVVGSLLWSLALQHYPPEKRRLFVVANNCTDSTATVVRSSGLASCHERNEGDLATKGAALGWLWERVSQETADYDCVLVLDADNLVAPDFLCEMNRTFDQGFRVVQSARCAKNAADSWASQLDAISEALWNRLDQAGRMELGISATIAGSGMAFERGVFEGLVGGGLPGLLEDVEWQARLMLAGIVVGYNGQARVYDEKTRKAGQLGRQRKRWVAGLALAARRYGLPLLRSGLRTGSLQKLVAAFGVTKPPRSLLFLLMGLMAAGGALLPAAPALLPWGFWAGAIAGFGLYVLLGMALDGARPSAYLALAYAPLFALLMVGASIAGGLRPSRQRWVPTSHERGIGIDQLP
ncbi:MAG: glycosyltransferase family 2 protein [Chloroflexota bacterium]